MVIKLRAPVAWINSPDVTLLHIIDTNDKNDTLEKKVTYKKGSLGGALAWLEAEMSVDPSCLNRLEVIVDPSCLDWLDVIVDPFCLDGLDVIVDPSCLNRLILIQTLKSRYRWMCPVHRSIYNF